MPRRSAALVTPASSTSRKVSPALPPPLDPFHDQLSLLRRQWKWAAFSQFFYTFANLFAMSDVKLTIPSCRVCHVRMNMLMFLSIFQDIEDDLTRSTSLVLPRVMHRLLVTLSGDRKLSLENWQTALRKQYFKRDPYANPIGPEPIIFAPTPSPEPQSPPAIGMSDGLMSDAEFSVEPPSETADVKVKENRRDNTQDAEAGPSNDLSATEGGVSRSGTEPQSIKEEHVASPKPEEEVEESKNWLELPMLTKLDSLYLLTEWQFQNPHRLRQIMKDDDETAQWRIEPVGYDAKTNAYWLIGHDRLWIQRVLPKPPRSLKRKRPAAKSNKKAKLAAH
ncbi:hypothetical protein EW146_g10245, partial [Bondarzewia mesenterica]